ncbi:WD40-repeat-containing domain protein, partial [Spinellus fusiger]
MYRLSSTFIGHEQDVKALSFLSNDLVVSAGRDKTVRAWKRIESQQFELQHTFAYHSHFVNCIATIPSQGLFVSSGSDKLIHVCSLTDTKDPLYTLIGHKENVCTVDTNENGDIVSGSWDKTAIVWKNFERAYVLKGHEAAVWCVLALEDEMVLTASADKTIRLWKQGQCVRTITGHTDVVRGLAKVPGIGFVSCSNDGTLRVWTLEGECIQELNGHTSFVYSVAVLSTGEYVSSGEDRTVRVWKGGECVQVIQQPCISVWTVEVLPNDDIVVGGSDANIRVFTRSEERAASAQDQKALNDILAQQAIPSNQLGDVNKDKLPGKEALSQPGTKEGQVLMINSGASVEAYQWNGSQQNWDKIGEVVGGVGSDRKQIYEGVEYDHVFDIDIGGGPNAMLKLPYNLHQNPYDAAQKFVHRHELPQGYLDEIANFITTNTKAPEIGAATQYHDPYTGVSRYTPAPPSSQQMASTGYSDPFTGSASYQSAQQIASAPRAPSTLPNKTYLALKQVNLAAVEAKLRSLATEHSLPLDPSISKVTEFLAHPQGASIDTAGLSTLMAACQIWPAQHRFPALDLLRLCVLYAPSSIAALLNGNTFPAFLEECGDLAHPSRDKIAETNAMLVYRGLANALYSETRDAMWTHRAVFLRVLQPEIVKVYSSKASQLAISTLAIK